MIDLAWVTAAIDIAGARLPRVRWYAFGSAAVYDGIRSDFDFLVVYQYQEDIDDIRTRLLGLATLLPVDIIFMTIDEELETDFVIRQHCIPLEKYL